MKGLVLKTSRSVKRRVGSNPTSSAKGTYSKFSIGKNLAQLVERMADNCNVVGSNPTILPLVPCYGRLAQQVVAFDY